MHKPDDPKFVALRRSETPTPPTPRVMRPLTSFPELREQVTVQITHVPSELEGLLSTEDLKAIVGLRFEARRYGKAPRERSALEQATIAIETDEDRITEPDPQGGSIFIEGHHFLAVIGDRSGALLLAWVEAFPGLVNTSDQHCIQLSHRHYKVVPELHIVEDEVQIA